MKDTLRNTLFLAKLLDNFEGFLTPGEDYGIVACRSSETVYVKYPNIPVYEVMSGYRTYSTQSIFKELLKNHHGLIGISNFQNIWTYQAYPWTNDLKIAGYKVFCIDYLLYLELQNKLNQRKFLLNCYNKHQSKSDSLRTQLLKSMDTLKSIIFPRYTMTYDKLIKKFEAPFVISDSYSDGGEGIFKITTESEYIYALSQVKSPVLKAELFLERGVPVNQLGFVLSNGSIIKYKPSIQIIQSVHHRNKLEYVGCDFNSEEHLPYAKAITKTISKSTHQVGKILYQNGYRGAFGCDYLIADNLVHFIEINPRYQASTLIATRSNGNDPNFAPHLLHILGFIDIPDKHLKNLRAFDNTTAFIDLNDRAEFRGFLKIYGDSSRVYMTPPRGIKIEDGIDRGYLLFKESIITNPYYPTQLKEGYSVW